MAKYLGNLMMSYDYYTFGMPMPGRQFNSGDYRYGFNGKEKDDEAKGAGNQYDYGFRIYDSRLGRFLSVDPLFSNFPYYTPYQFSGNKPIVALDLDGLEDVWVHHLTNPDGSTITLTLFKEDDNFKLVRQSLAMELGLNPENFPESGSLMTSATQEEYGGPQENIRIAYLPTTTIDEYRYNIVERNLWKLNDYYLERQGTDGFQMVADEVSDASTVVKLAGVVTTFFNPVAGMRIYEFGDLMDAGGTMTSGAVDFSNGDNSSGTIKLSESVVGFLFGRKTESLLDKGMIDRVQKLGADAAADQLLDKAKDEALDETETE